MTEEPVLDNPWTSLESLRMIAEEMLMPVIIHKWGSTELLRSLKHKDGFNFKLIVLPSGGALRFFLESGNPVKIFIRGLSFFGGDGIFTSPLFWEQMKEILSQVKKLHRPSDLVPAKMFAYQGHRSFKATKDHPFPDLLPKEEIEITNITMKITAVHSKTGATVTFHQPLDYVPNSEVTSDARIKLSMLVNEWEHTTYRTSE